MSHQYLAIALSLVTTAPSAPEPSVSIDLGLSAPVERLAEVDAFANLLADRLVWTIEDSGEDRVRRLLLRFSAVRIDRGRVTASYQSEAVPAQTGRSSIAGTIGMDEFLAFRDVCLTSEDPPAGVQTLSGAARLDDATMERMVADVARSGELGPALGLEEPLELEWGHHVVLILSATSSDDSAVVRPLVLVLERI